MIKELTSCQDVNMRDDNGWTCLHWAALRGATDQWLLCWTVAPTV